MLRYILFHHQTTTLPRLHRLPIGCVISSFITKPQHQLIENRTSDVALYPLSSPNHNTSNNYKSAEMVALYPLSSPNHNILCLPPLFLVVALYPLSSPNHNKVPVAQKGASLRYILFHHQTTTIHPVQRQTTSCVISSFITKPQQVQGCCSCSSVALYPLSSPNHNLSLYSS